MNHKLACSFFFFLCFFFFFYLLPSVVNIILLDKFYDCKVITVHNYNSSNLRVYSLINQVLDLFSKITSLNFINLKITINLYNY